MLGDTIVALASAPGLSDRAVLRISGPRAHEVAARVFVGELPRRRGRYGGAMRIFQDQLPAFALVMMGPRSFTGEDVVELHVPGGPVLVRHWLAAMLADGTAFGVRHALPGEFTARAVQNGKLDGAAAEGLLLLLHATTEQELASANQWLHGSLGQAVRAERERLQDVLALVEVGLDFAEGDTGEVPAAVWSPSLEAVQARLGELRRHVPGVAPGGEALLLGRANAGKSSLANALAGRDEVLVSEVPGTTRDVLRVEIGDGAAVFDAPGDLDQPSEVDALALQLRDQLAADAGSLLIVLDATAPWVPPAAWTSPLPWAGVVWTKLDLVAAVPALPEGVAPRLSEAVPVFPTSSVDGRGLDRLREWLRRLGTRRRVDVGGPLRHTLDTAQAAVARALANAGQGAECVAVDLQAAIGALDQLTGQHSAEPVLDRIYARFCLGK
jgi:tRNA modification GTPase